MLLQTYYVKINNILKYQPSMVLPPSLRDLN